MFESATSKVLAAIIVLVVLAAGYALYQHQYVADVQPTEPAVTKTEPAPVTPPPTPTVPCEQQKHDDPGACINGEWVSGVKAN